MWEVLSCTPQVAEVGNLVTAELHVAIIAVASPKRTGLVRLFRLECSV